MAERLLEPLGRRWRHTVGVVARAQFVSHLLDQHEADVLVAAAYLHDIGYAPELQNTMFHPLDGARFLRAVGNERLARLVAHHTGARLEAEQRGLGSELTEFTEERSLVAELPTYCDLTASPHGEPVEAADRLEEIIKERCVERHGDAAPGRAAQRSAPQLLALARRAEARFEVVRRRR